MCLRNYQKLDKWREIVIYDKQECKREIYKLDFNQRLVNKMPIYKRPRSKKGVIRNVSLQVNNDEKSNQDQKIASSDQCIKEKNDSKDIKKFNTDESSNSKKDEKNKCEFELDFDFNEQFRDLYSYSDFEFF